MCKINSPDLPLWQDIFEFLGIDPKAQLLHITVTESSNFKKF